MKQRIYYYLIKNHKGFALIIFIIIIALLSGGIVGGTYLASKNPQIRQYLKLDKLSNLQKHPLNQETSPDLKTSLAEKKDSTASASFVGFVAPAYLPKLFKTTEDLAEDGKSIHTYYQCDQDPRGFEIVQGDVKKNKIFFP